MIKKLKTRFKQFKAMNGLEKLLVVALLYLVARGIWPFLQIIYTLICNIISLHG